MRYKDEKDDFVIGRYTLIYSLLWILKKCNEVGFNDEQRKDINRFLLALR